MNTAILPTDILCGEHEAVQRKLDSLERCITHLDKKESAAELDELISFFNTEFWVHFEKEEKAFFPEFDTFMPRGVGPLAVMRDEHELLRNTEEMLAQAISVYFHGNGKSNIRQSILQYGMHFVESLRSHIAKENGLLPAMAELHLKRAQNERIVRAFDEIEKAKTGSIKVQ